MDCEELTGRIIACAMRVHRQLGPGLLESPYKACLAYEFLRSGIHFSREVPIRVVYDGKDMNIGVFADFIVEQTIIVEVKAVQALDFVHEAQVISYLKLSGCPIGLLMNFNTVLLKTGLRRLYNKTPC
jgi:GxxExxY protein